MEGGNSTRALYSAISHDEISIINSAMRPSREQNIQNITDLEKQKHEDFEEGLAEEETDLDANKTEQRQ